MSGQLEKAREQLGGFQKTIAGVGTALAGAISFDAIRGEVSELVGAMGNIADQADKIGISAEAVQRLGYAASQSGSSMESVASSIGIMASKLASEKADEKLQSIGLSLDAIKGLSPDQTFLAIAEQIRNVKDPLQQSALAMEFFGRGGTELLPAIKAGIADVAAQAPVMSDATVAAGDAAGDAFDTLQGKIAALKAQALTPLLSAFTSLPEPLQMAGVGLLSVGSVAAQLLPALAMTGGLGGAIGMVTSAFSAMLPFLGPAGLIAIGLFAVYEVWKHWDTITAYVSGAYNAVREWLVDKLSAAWSAVTSGITATVETIGKLLAIGGPLLGPVGAVYTIWKNWDRITEIAKGVYDGVKAWLVDKFTALVQSIKGKIDAVTGFFAGMYDAVVGHSYVPDMIRGIQSEFAKLDFVMVQPSQQATATTAGIWSQFAATSKAEFGKLFSGEGLGGVIASFAQNGVAGLKSFAQQGIESLMGMVPIVGPFLQQFSGPIMDGLGKIGSAIKKLFGGPSKEEIEGRGVAKAFRDEVASMLSEAQRLEAGNDEWKKSVIAVRDAYIAAGHTEREALDVMDRLWRAEKQGGDAVKNVIGEIRTVMDATKASTDAALTSATGGFDSLAGSIRTATQLTAGLGAAMGDVASLAAVIGNGNMGAFRGGPNGDKAPDFMGSLADWIALNPGGIEQFMADNNGDLHRILEAKQIKGGWGGIDWRALQAAAGYAVPGFATGTPYLDFMNFGRGTNVRLHGDEAVVPKSRAAEFAARHVDMSGVESRLDRLEHSLLTVLPKVMRDTAQQAM